MDLDQLALFRDIVQLRSISRGAELHGVTQSAASQTVQELERLLDVRLLDRAHRPLDVTAAGRIVFDFARDMLMRRNELDAELEQVRKAVAPRVRLACIYSIGLSEMARLEAAFARRMPEARLDVEYLRPEKVYGAVQDDRADLGVVSYPEPARDLELLRWREEPMVVAAAPAHPFSRYPRLRASDLDNADFIAFDADLPIARHIERFLRDHGARVRTLLHFDNIQSMKEALREGKGVSVLPEPVLRAEIADGRLRAVPLFPVLLRPLGILYRRKRAMPRAVQTFLEVLRAPSA